MTFYLVTILLVDSAFDLCTCRVLFMVSMSFWILLDCFRDLLRLNLNFLCQLQMCGNGIRCVAKYLAELEKATAPKR